MNKEALDFIVEKTHELMNAATCSREAGEAAQKWLAALGTEKEEAETAEYFAELEADIVTAEGLMAFAESEAGAKVFGAEAPNVASHARELKAAGARYCDCPACAAAEAILAQKNSL